MTLRETTDIHSLPVSKDNIELVKFRVTATLKMRVCTTPGTVPKTAVSTGAGDPIENSPNQLKKHLSALTLLQAQLTPVLHHPC